MFLKTVAGFYLDSFRKHDQQPSCQQFKRFFAHPSESHMKFLITLKVIQHFHINYIIQKKLIREVRLLHWCVTSFFQKHRKIWRSFNIYM